MENVRSLDADSPALIAQATRLSNLYGVSLGSELARKGVKEGGCRRRRRRRNLGARKSLAAIGDSSDTRDRLGSVTEPTRREKRVLRRALEKAGEAAMQYTIEASAGMKAFDGPPLGPRDVRELLLRSFRIKLSVSEATALIEHFTKVTMGGAARRKGERCTQQHFGVELYYSTYRLNSAPRRLWIALPRAVIRKQHIFVSNQAQ